MKRSYLLITASFLVGALVSSLASYLYWNNQLANHPHPEPVVHNEMVMEGMTNALEGKTGVQFDNEFLHEMIMHHAGAIEMAKLAKEKATLPEIKTLSDEIIEAQSREIKLMEGWHDKVHENSEGLH